MRKGTRSETRRGTRRKAREKMRRRSSRGTWTMRKRGRGQQEEGGAGGS